MDLIEVLSDGTETFAIYGAQVVAYGAYTAILHLCCRKPECFIVSNLAHNPEAIDGIPVRTPDAISKDTLIVIGVTELLQGEIVSGLEKKGFRNLFVLTQHEEHLLMSAYFKSIDKFPVACEIREDCDAAGEAYGALDDFVLYEVRNHRDKPLRYPPGRKPFEMTIQAGAALTEKRIAEWTDDTGINISKKNRQYCEMSATYWVWKNTNHKWTGIEHYRRHLLIKPEILHGDVDVILPLPYICYPNTIAQFRRFVSEDVFQALLQALQTLHPKEFDRYREILYGPYQYTYNLLCGRRLAFADYCDWFFRITEYMESMEDKVPELRCTRALSYVAEALTNLYFMYNEKEWKILHVEKGIYV